MGDKLNARPNIRPATGEDIEAMTGLLQALFSIETDFEFAPDKTGRGLELLLEQPECAVVLVAESRGKLIGMCTLQLLVSTAVGGLAGLVEDMVVDEAWRGAGVGRLLLQTLEQWAREKGVTRLQLLADRHNDPALSFYKALGWSATQLVALHRFPDA